MRRLLFFDFYPLLLKSAATLVRENIEGVQVVEVHNLSELEDIMDANDPVEMAIVGVGPENDFRGLEQIDSKGMRSVVLYYDSVHIRYIRGTFTHVTGLASKLLDKETFITFIKQVLQRGKGVCPVTMQYFFDQLYSQQNPVPKPSAGSNELESLTKREKEVFLLLKQGKSMLTISKELKIHASTASGFKRKIYAKLKVRNVIDLVERYG